MTQASYLSYAKLARLLLRGLQLSLLPVVVAGMPLQYPWLLTSVSVPVLVLQR